MTVKGSIKPSISVGERFTTSKGCEIEVVEYVKAIEVYVKFLDGTDYIKKTTVSCIKAGNVATPYYKGAHGVGYIGEGPYKSKNNGVGDEAYSRWSGIIERCYSVKSHLFPAYQDCFVDAEWHNFQNFAKWFYNHKYNVPNWHIDKDILVEGNRMYSESTCCFLPSEINSFFHVESKSNNGLPTGVKEHSTCKGFYEVFFNKKGTKTYVGFYKNVDEAFAEYKVVKEKRLKELAAEYKSLLEPRVYERLMSFEVKNDAANKNNNN